MIPEAEEKDEPEQVEQVSDTSEIQTYSFSELKFKKIGDLDVFAKKTASGIMVMLWKLDRDSSTALNKYTIELYDQENNEQPIILQKKKLLLFRLTNDLTYKIVIKGFSTSGEIVAESELM